MVQIEPLASQVPYHICPGSESPPGPAFLDFLRCSPPPPPPSPLTLQDPPFPPRTPLPRLSDHEDNNDFIQYRMRLGAAMPRAFPSKSAGGNGTFHSFNVGLIHVALVSSEVYFSLQPHSAGLAVEQAVWLEADLKAVDRAATPFVVLGLHQPFYCSANDDQDDCHQIASLVRIGLEKIIYEGGVDVVFQ
jgi:hypothetical protein